VAHYYYSKLTDYRDAVPETLQGTLHLSFHHFHQVTIGN